MVPGDTAFNELEEALCLGDQEFESLQQWTGSEDDQTTSCPQIGYQAT